MTLQRLIHIIWRWRVVVLAVVALTTGGLVVRGQLRAPTYSASVKLQLTAAEQEAVSLFDSYRAGNVRDELGIARNNLSEILTSSEPTKRTIASLGLEGSAARYEVSITTVRDSDFLYVTFTAADPGLVAAIADTHVGYALAYFGEVRAKPATATKDFLAAELQQLSQERRAADSVFRTFRTQHNIAFLDRAQANMQDLINQLQREHDQQMIDRPTSRTVERIDASIAQRQTELATLIALEQEYNTLQNQVTELAGREELLQRKYTEAALKEAAVQEANFIQVIEAATQPEKPVATSEQVVLALGMLGSLGLGILLAVASEYLSTEVFARNRLARPTQNTASSTEGLHP